MRNILYGFILGITLLPTSAAWSQPDTLWSRNLDLSGASALYGATSVADGFVAVGFAVNGSSGRDMLVAKVSTIGQVLWTRMYGTTRNEDAWGVVEMSDGQIFVTGFGVDASNSRNVIVIAGLSPAGDSLWWRTYGSAGQSKARDAVLLNDGNIAVIGYGLGADGIASDMWLLKCQPNGDTLWTRMYGGQQTDTGYRLSQRPDGGFALAGATASSGGGGDDPWLVLTDALGNLQTQLTFGMSGQQYANACAVNENGEIFVGGRGSSLSGPALVVKCNAAGGVVWSNYYDSEPASQVRGLLPQLGGNALCVGANASSGTRSWLMAVNADGAIEWSWTMQLPGSELNGVVAAASGGALAFGMANNAGYLLRIGPPSGIAGIVRETVTGAPVPNVCVTTVGSSFVAVTGADGRFALARSPGMYTLTAYGPCVESDTFETVQAFADSIVEVELTIGTPDYEQPRTSLNITAYNRIASETPLILYNYGSGSMNFEIQTLTIAPPTDWLRVNPASGYVAAGESLAVSVIVDMDTTDTGVFDLFGYLHLRTNSCPDSTDDVPVLVTLLDAEESFILPPSSFRLSAYPNPFNLQSVISFSIPRENNVHLEVFNTVGQRVRDLLQERLSAGEHRARFDASDLPSGLYFARLISGNLVATQKILLLK